MISKSKKKIWKFLSQRENFFLEIRRCIQILTFPFEIAKKLHIHITEITRVKSVEINKNVIQYFLLSQFYDFSTIAIDYGGVLSNKKQAFYGLFNKIPINLFSFFWKWGVFTSETLKYIPLFYCYIGKNGACCLFRFWEKWLNFITRIFPLPQKIIGKCQKDSLLPIPHCGRYKYIIYNITYTYVHIHTCVYYA